MTDNSSEKHFVLYKIRNQRAKPLLRSKQYNMQQSDSSKSFNDNTSFDNKSEYIKPSSLSLLNRITKIDKIKISKISSPKVENKYSNEKLFSNRISKGLLFYNKMKMKNSKNLQNNTLVKLQKRKINFDMSHHRKNNSFLLPKKLPYKRMNFFSVDQKPKYNLINPILTPIIRKNLFIKNSSIYFPHLNSSSTSNIFLPKSCSKSFDETFMNKKEHKEKEKIAINENLINLLYKIKKRILPKRKLIFEKYKLPNINNIKLKNIKSCIHHEENYKGEIEFIKTHLDGITKPKYIIPNRYKSQKRFEINEGYIDLEVLGDGDDVSFKTNLMEKNGLLFYEFNKKGDMDTIEGKIHKIQKDKKELKKLLQKYNQNEIFKTIQAKDFEKIKKYYGTDSIIINNNIYRDLYHLLFKNKSKRNFKLQK